MSTAVVKKRKRISYRDALSEDFARDYPFAVFKKGASKDAFSIRFKRADFDYFEFLSFWDSIGLVGAKYTLCAEDCNIVVKVSRYRGTL